MMISKLFDMYCSNCPLLSRIRQFSFSLYDKRIPPCIHTRRYLKNQKAHDIDFSKFPTPNDVRGLVFMPNRPASDILPL